MKEKPSIAITFDDGPSGRYTGRLLDGLKERNVKASFFLIGENAEENPVLVERIYKEGHLIGNHTYSHVQMTHLSEEAAVREIEKTDQVISAITGEHVAYMRPSFWRVAKRTGSQDGGTSGAVVGGPFGLDDRKCRRNCE